MSLDLPRGIEMALDLRKRLKHGWRVENILSHTRLCERMQSKMQWIIKYKHFFVNTGIGGKLDKLINLTQPQEQGLVNDPPPTKLLSMEDQRKWRSLQHSLRTSLHHNKNKQQSTPTRKVNRTCAKEVTPETDDKTYSSFPSLMLYSPTWIAQEGKMINNTMLAWADCISLEMN